MHMGELSSHSSLSETLDNAVPSIMALRFATISLATGPKRL